MDKTCENNYDDTYRPPLQRLFKIGGKSFPNRIAAHIFGDLATLKQWQIQILGRVAVLIETLSSNQPPDGLSHNLSVEMISQLLMQRGFHWEGLVDETLQVTRGPDIMATPRPNIH